MSQSQTMTPSGIARLSGPGPGHCGGPATPRAHGYPGKVARRQQPELSRRREVALGMLRACAADLRTGIGTWSIADIVESPSRVITASAPRLGSDDRGRQHSTSYLSDSDSNAIATYLKSLPASSSQQAAPMTMRQRWHCATGPTTQPRCIYAGACASCHGFDAKASSRICRPSLQSGVLDLDPSSLINLMLHGSIPLVPGVLRTPYRIPIQAAVVRPGHP